MTDARFPERWLNNRRIMGLDGDAFKLWIVALAWCAANRTDGVLTDDDLGQLPHSVDIIRMEALWGADLMERDREAGRWVVIDYADTQLTRAELEALDEKRVKARVKKARQRAAAGTVPGDVPGDCTGQDRTGPPRPRLRTRTKQSSTHSEWRNRCGIPTPLTAGASTRICALTAPARWWATWTCSPA